MMEYSEQKDQVSFYVYYFVRLKKKLTLESKDMWQNQLEY